MKVIIFISVFVWSISIYATGLNDSIPEDPYIEYHKNQLNVKFNIENDINTLHIPFEGKTAKISPNITTRYSLGFNYKFASVRLGIRTGISDDAKVNKGETDVFKFRIGFLFNEWSHKFEYNYIKGFYVKNNEEFEMDDINDIHYQLPDLKTNMFSGSSSYKFNKNYSVRAIKSQTEIQIKSAGSFMPGIQYWLYKIHGSEKMLNPFKSEQERAPYNDFKGFSALLNAGYYHTFVYKKYWYANVHANAGAGYDFYNITTYENNNDYDKSYSDPIFSLQSGFAAGYNSKKYFFGVEWNNRIIKGDIGKQSLDLHTSANSFLVFIGYRFKAPKLISKPIDDLQEIVPILQDDYNKN
ncbi:MAG: DUF4421 family protein [Bacteroidota bacterium]